MSRPSSASAPFCDGCVKPGTPVAHVPRGTEQKFADVDCYVVGSGDPSTHAIIINTDIYGWRLPAVRALADKYQACASRDGVEFTVYVANYLAEPIDASPEGLKGFLSRMMEWVEANRPTFMSVSQRVAEEAKKRHKSLQCVGFCLGGKPSMALLQQPGLCVAGALCHPSLLQAEDADTLSTSTFFVCAETDRIFVPELRAAFEARLQARTNAPRTQFKTFPKTTHGFCVRPEGEDECRESKLANDDLVEWFHANAKAASA